MKIKYNQTSVGWCTAISWANLLDKSSLLDFVGIERYKGCDEEQELEIISTVLEGMKMRTIAYIEPGYGKLDIDTIFSCITRKDEHKLFEEQCVIYVLCVKLIESKEYYHHVGIVNYNGRLFYEDPYRENWIEIKECYDLLTLFSSCIQIQRPLIIKDNAFASFDGRQFDYPFKEIL